MPNQSLGGNDGLNQRRFFALANVVFQDLLAFGGVGVEQAATERASSLSVKSVRDDCADSLFPVDWPFKVQFRPDAGKFG